MERKVTLGEYLERRMAENDLNPRLISANSQNQVAHTTIYDLSKNKGGSPSISTLQAIAKGFKKPGIEEEIFRVARGLVVDLDNPSYEQEDVKLLALWKELPDPQRKTILRFMEFQLQEVAKEQSNKDMK
jgi:hypothetical protein